jgi:hypothetical protein
VLAAVLLAACGTERLSADPDPTPSTSPSETTSAEPDPGVDELVVPAAAASLPATWHERFVVPYGAGQALLGTSPGGDSGTLDLGPEYGAPSGDGTWWFLDAAKRRLAHYDADGRYLDAVPIPTSLLVGGVYFQWQLPHVMGDGTLVTVRHTPDRSYLLRLRDGVLDEIPVNGSFSPTYANDLFLYGFDDDGGQVVVDPDDGEMVSSSTFTTAARTPFQLTLKRRGLRIEMPQSDVDEVLPLTTSSGAKAHVGLQVRAGADDVLHLFLIGIGDDDESAQLVGYTSVSPDGTVHEVEALPDPFSESDPGSPAQLAMAPGSSTPMLVYVLEDGVHVYERLAG